MADIQTLNAVHLRAIHLLLEGNPKSMVARECSVSPQTLEAWRRDPVWRFRYRAELEAWNEDLRDVPFTAQVTRLQALQTQIEKLLEVVPEKTEHVIAIAHTVKDLLEATRKESEIPVSPPDPVSRPIEAAFSEDVEKTDAEQIEEFCQEIESFAAMRGFTDRPVSEFVTNLRAMIAKALPAPK